MPGVRVYQLAKELRVQSALIVELLDRLGKEVHSDLSSIDDVTASLARERLTVALAGKKKRLHDEKRTDEETAAAAPPVDAPVEPPPPIPEEAPVAPVAAAPAVEAEAEPAPRPAISTETATEVAKAPPAP